MLDPTTVIPHRAPYLFLTGCDGQGNATADAPQHAAQLIEVCAQAAASMHGGATGEPQAGVMVGVRRFTIARAPTRGEPLMVSVHLKARLGPQTMFNCEVRDASGAAVAAGDLAFALTGGG